MTRTRTATTRTIARALGAALLVAACAAPGPAGAQTAWQQVCIDAWDDAPAELYCSAGVARVGAASDGSTGHCYVSRISCSINVTVAITGGEAAGSYTASRYSMTQTPEDTEDITLCFAIDDDAWEMNLNVGACGSGEIDLDTARSTGLPLIETESADGDRS